MHAAILWLAMFAACLSLDFVYTRWMQNVQQNRRFKAAMYSGLCVLVNYVIVILCVDDHALVIPACLGAALGTPLAMGRSK